MVHLACGELIIRVRQPAANLTMVRYLKLDDGFACMLVLIIAFGMRKTSQRAQGTKTTYWVRLKVWCLKSIECRTAAARGYLAAME